MLRGHHARDEIEARSYQYIFDSFLFSFLRQ
nr:MAG TPA: hypothetical protein [Caudoviricetes sp.]